jgi:hypothetical protein
LVLPLLREGDSASGGIEVRGEKDVSVGVGLFQEGVGARAGQKLREEDTTAAAGLGLRGSWGRHDLTG